MALEKIMNEKMARIIEFFLDNPAMDYSREDIVEQTGVSRSTVHRKWGRLEELGLVEKTRRYQNTQLYRLDSDSGLVNDLGRLKRRLEDRENSPQELTA